MPRQMTRGKQQILLNYLPGRTFDFEKSGTIARVEKIRGVRRTDLNVSLVLRAVEDHVRAWSADYRPVFRDLDRSADRFVLLEPSSVQAAMFPLVFWCQNSGCGLVMSSDTPPRTQFCSRCSKGRIVQVRFVKVHRCGELQPLTPLPCRRCGPSGPIALDTRGSERIADFQWICRKCGTTASLFPGRCRACQWPDASLRTMNIEVHRAGRVYYPHYEVLLNQPGGDLSAFLNIDRWQAIAAAFFLELKEVENQRLSDFVRGASSTQESSPFALSDDEFVRLRARGISEDDIKRFQKLQAELAATRSETQAAISPAGLATRIQSDSGVNWDVWKSAGQELLEAVMPVQSGSVTRLSTTDRQPARELAASLGFGEVTLVTDFPITTATFGFSRLDYSPDTCRLNPFPPDPDYGGRFPIFVDLVEADAVIVRLDHEAVLRWMSLNGFSPTLPMGTDTSLSRRAYFVRLANDTSFRQTLGADRTEARLAFGLLHTLAHLSLRRAAVLCGLEGASLSEYVLPSALTFALYCNHRFGATIGALVALFEQSLGEWLTLLRDTRRCVYDPLCAEHEAACHACSHLPETSCRFFNLNLSRALVFGGTDPVLGPIKYGFFDISQ